MTYRDAMRLAARLYLEGVLTACLGNRAAAARVAGVHRSDLYRLAKRAGLQMESRLKRGNDAWRRLQ